MLHFKLYLNYFHGSRISTISFQELMTNDELGEFMVLGGVNEEILGGEEEDRADNLDIPRTQEDGAESAAIDVNDAQHVIPYVPPPLPIQFNGAFTMAPPLRSPFYDLVPTPSPPAPPPPTRRPRISPKPKPRYSTAERERIISAAK